MTTTHHLVADPQPIRDRVLRSDTLLDIAAAGGDVVAGITPGVGKTTGYVNLILSRFWIKRGFRQVVVALPTRKVLEEVRAKLADSGLVVEVYPSVDDPRDAPCAPDNIVLKELLGRGLAVHAAVSICGRCPDQEECPFSNRHDRIRFHAAEVLLVCEAPLTKEPAFIWNICRSVPDPSSGEPPRVLTIIDEAVAVRTGFISTFSETDVIHERDLAVAVGDADLSAALDHLIQRPTHRWRGPIPDGTGEPARWQRLGNRLWDNYVYRLPLMLAFLARPLWYEDGVYAVARFPRLPGPVMFFGASLTADLLRWRYGCPRVVDLLPGVIVRHPETRVVVLRSSAFTPSNWLGNASSIGAFIADLLLREAAAGRTACVLTRKDVQNRPFATLTHQAITKALAAREGAHIALLGPSETLPSEPTVGQVPIITVGAIGVNAYEEYDTIVQAMAFYAPLNVIRDMAFGDLPPSERPCFTLDGARKPVWDHEPTDENRQRVAMAIHLLEVDPIVQGLCRVRGSIKPRLVVACTRHNLQPHLGPCEVATSITVGRRILDLGTTVGNRQERLTRRIQARYAERIPLRTIADELGVGYATVRRLAEQVNLPVRRGRPRKVLNSNILI